MGLLREVWGEIILLPPLALLLGVEILQLQQQPFILDYYPLLHIVVQVQLKFTELNNYD